MSVHFSSIFEKWLSWHGKNVFPRSGGWEDQKLSDLASFNALELVYTTYTYINGKDVDFSTLSKTQLDVITYLEN